MKLLTRIGRRHAHGVPGRVENVIGTYDRAIAFIDSTRKWGAEETDELVSIVRPIAPAFSGRQVDEWRHAMAIGTATNGAGPDAEVRRFLKRQIKVARNEFVRIEDRLP